MLQAHTLAPEEHYIRSQPYYEPVGNEIAIFEAAYRNRLPAVSYTHLTLPTIYSV